MGWNSPLQGRKVPVLPCCVPSSPQREGLVGSAAPISRADVNGGIAECCQNSKFNRGA